MNSIRYSACSFTGRRKGNEDSYLAVNLAPDSYLFAVADGMGGAAAGEIASSLAIEAVRTYFGESFDARMSYTHDQLKQMLRDSIIKSSDLIKDAIEKQPSYSGMGTTLVILAIVRDRYIWANIGDSRLYRIENGICVQLTRDHTYIQQYLDTKPAQPDRELLDKYSNYLTRVLDGAESIADIFPIDKDWEEIRENTCFLLCTDGLIPDKSKSEGLPFASLVRSSADINNASEQLVSHAYFNGSTDNITVILAETPGFKHKYDKKKRLPFPPADNAGPQRRKGNVSLLFYLLLTGLLTCLAAIVLILFYPSSSGSPGTVNEFAQNGNFTSREQPREVGSSINLDGIQWEAFDQDLYNPNWPLNSSSSLAWAQCNNNLPVSQYRLIFYSERNQVDSVTVKSRIQKLNLSDLNFLQRGKAYRVEIKAIMNNGSVIDGNEIDFKFQ